MIADNPYSHDLAVLINNMLERDSSVDSRRKIYMALAAHLGMEHAFLKLEGTVTSEIEKNFDASFQDGLRTAAREHRRICKNGDACLALGSLRDYIRHAPRLKTDR